MGPLALLETWLLGQSRSLIFSRWRSCGFWMWIFLQLAPLTKEPMVWHLSFERWFQLSHRTQILALFGLVLKTIKSCSISILKPENFFKQSAHFQITLLSQLR